MNMNKALQNLYHAVSGSTTTKVNISKLLVDIHYAITGKESSNKNNWSRIIDSMATNWPEGGGGTTIEALTVTENDTYTAPEGKAYSPVTVNVGGSSSDFSTATVTVNASEFGVDVIPVYIIDDAIVSDAAIIGNTYTVPLYKNECRWLLMNPYTVTVSGNATYDEENGVIIITGDCTITIS